MLKELSHIARSMMFLHGHLTRPQDWAETPEPAPAAGKKAPAPSPKLRRPSGGKVGGRKIAAAFTGLTHAGTFR